MKAAAKASTKGAKGAAYDAGRVAELAGLILHHKRVYYAGKPEVSDPEYDRMEDELRCLAPEHPVLAYVGTEPAADAPKVKHDEPMLSLQKTYDLAELVKWADAEKVVGTVKVDGVSLALIYEDGRLTLAKTRGSGIVGEDVTAKIRWVADALPTLTAKGRLEIRGEIYCTESQFLRLSDAMAELQLERPTSPRNIVAGLLGRKSHIDLARYFNFFAFTVIDPQNGLALATEEGQFDWLGKQGFRLPHPRACNGEQEVTAYVEHVKKLLEDDEVPIDGAVFSYDSLAKQRGLGNTSHHPRYKMSFKWQGQTAVSTVREVTWATSRLGIVTPVAVIEPVHLSGAQITNVTLHNAAHVKAFNLKAGDKIEIVRSGEVIPKFLSIVEAAPGTYVWPDACPACGTTLTFDDVRLKCPNTEGCPAQQLGAVLNWIRSAEIDDLSDKRLLPLMDEGLVKTAADLYRLKLEDFYRIPQTKEKMATKLFQNIQKSRTLPLARFLNGLGIEGAGLTTWDKLLAEFPTLEALLAATAEQIAGVEGFAEKSAGDITAGLVARRSLIDDLLAAGVTPVAEAPIADDGPLAGKTIVITGALSRPRAEIEKAIKVAGGKTASSVSKETFAVVTEDPDSGSSKMKKARQLGVLTWSEADLWRALGVEG